MTDNLETGAVSPTPINEAVPQTLPLPTNFPLASTAVRMAFAEFWAHNHYFDQAAVEAEQAEHLKQVNTTLEFFFPHGGLAEATYAAATLAPLINRDQYSNVREAIAHYLTGPSLTKNETDHLTFTENLFVDFSTLDQFWQTETTQVYQKNPALYSALREYDSMSITPELWQSKPITIPPSHILRLMGNLQIQSAAIAAARTLVKLRSGDNSADSLRQVFQAESLLAPILEIIAEDKKVENNNKHLLDFAMVLNSAAKCVRLENAGEGQFIDFAKESLARHGSHEDVARSVAAAIRAITNADIENDGLSTEYDEENHIVSFSGYATVNGERMYFFGRRKSRGSLADKIRGYYQDLEQQFANGKISAEEFRESAKTENLEPMDFVALTFVPLRDNAHKHMMFAQMAKRARDDVNITFKPSLSRTQALHVRGTGRHRSGALSAFAKVGFANSQTGLVTDDIIEEKDDVRGMNLAKMTLTYDSPDDDLPPLPIEIQFVDRTARHEMAIGIANHLDYGLEGKSKKREGLSDTTIDLARAREAAKDLAELNRRGADMGMTDVYPVRDSDKVRRWLQRIGGAALIETDQQ